MLSRSIKIYESVVIFLSENIVLRISRLQKMLGNECLRMFTILFLNGSDVKQSAHNVLILRHTAPNEGQI